MKTVLLNRYGKPVKLSMTQQHIDFAKNLGRRYKFAKNLVTKLLYADEFVNDDSLVKLVYVFDDSPILISLIEEKKNKFVLYLHNKELPFNFIMNYIFSFVDNDLNIHSDLFENVFKPIYYQTDDARLKKLIRLVFVLYSSRAEYTRYLRNNKSVNIYDYLYSDEEFNEIVNYVAEYKEYICMMLFISNDKLALDLFNETIIKNDIVQKYKQQIEINDNILDVIKNDFIPNNIDIVNEIINSFITNLSEQRIYKITNLLEI